LLVRKSSRTEFSILKLIHELPFISRVELAEHSGLSTAAVTGIVGSLLAKNLLSEEPYPDNRVGRKRVSLRLRSDLAYVIGIDLGTYNLRVVITDLNGTIVALRQTPTRMNTGRVEVLDRTFSIVRELIAEVSLDLSQIRGIGIAFSGVIDASRGVILSYPRPGQVEHWKNIPLSTLVEEAFGVPCIVVDSVRAVATIEKHSGAGRTLKDYVYVDVGMGVGSAIFINGSIFSGSKGNAGEFGHLTVDKNGPLCSCGSTGCLEAMACCATVIAAVQHAIQRGVSSRISEFATAESADPGSLTVEIIAKAAENNDSLALRVLHEAANYIGAAASDLINLLNPEAVIFGGALFRAAPDLLIESIRRTVRERAMEKAANDVTLMVSPLTGDAGARGAARLVSESILESIFHEVA
jgi:predicted NBD/HSP70 family sugar kinase